MIIIPMGHMIMATSDHEREYKHRYWKDHPEVRERARALRLQRVENDPALPEREREQRRQRQNDPEFKERARARRLKRLENDPGLLEQERERKRHRWKNDPAFRARGLATAKTPERRAAHREHARNIRLDRSLWPKAILSSIRARAKKVGVSFDLTALDLIIPRVCPVLGIPITLGGRGNPNGPSVDRIIPALGYVKGNVRVISFRANHLKSDCIDHTELQKVVDYIRDVCCPQAR